MTVLRPDTANPEPIQDGTGWTTTYDAPTRPAGHNPLTMARLGREHGSLPEPAGHLDAFDRISDFNAVTPPTAADRGHRRTADRPRPDQASDDRRPATRPAGDYPVDFGPPHEAGPADSRKLIQLHDSIGALLASRGEWRQAYQHLRSALDLVYTDRSESQVPVPEQLRREVDRLRREHAEAREQSIRDSLTASYNRRFLDQRLTSLLADTAGANARGGLAVALVDLDWFKQVNDTFGHLIGDRVLQRVVELLSDGLPEGAFCARYGGEEFVLVLPGIDAATAIAVAEAARARVERNPWSHLAPGLRVTVSVGLAHLAPMAVAGGRAATSAEHQLLRADGLLYAAKQSGRNAVAYRHGGQVLLAGAAAERRRIVESRGARTPDR